MSGSAAATSLKRAGSTEYTGMLVAMCMPSNWERECKLLRFVEVSGAQTLITVTGKALPAFNACEVGSVYAFQVQGKCVRSMGFRSKFGVRGMYEVNLQFPPSNFKKIDTTAGFTMHYNFTDLSDLNGKEKDSTVDIVGTVIADKELHTNTSFPKASLLLASNEMHQEVLLLGIHANSVVATIGDVVAFAGLQVKEWKNQRTLETTLLTVIETNPARRAGIPAVSAPSDGTPKKKALRMTMSKTSTVQDVLSWHDAAVAKTKAGEDSGSLEVSLQGVLAKLDASFFVDDPPLLGSEVDEKMCLKTEFADATGTATVKVWSKPCQNLFGIGAKQMREIWEDGAERADRQEQHLTTLNACLESPVVLNCTVSLWTYGWKEVKHVLQINVNQLEIVAAST